MLAPQISARPLRLRAGGMCSCGARAGAALMARDPPSQISMSCKSAGRALKIPSRTEPAGGAFTPPASHPVRCRTGRHVRLQTERGLVELHLLVAADLVGQLF